MHGSIHFMHFEGIGHLVERGIEVPLGYIAPNFISFQSMFFDIDTIQDQAFQEHLKNLKK